MLLAPKDLPGRHFYGDDVRSKLPLEAALPENLRSRLQNIRDTE